MHWSHCTQLGVSAFTSVLKFGIAASIPCTTQTNDNQYWAMPIVILIGVSAECKTEFESEPSVSELLLSDIVLIFFESFDVCVSAYPERFVVQCRTASERFSLL